MSSKCVKNSERPKVEMRAKPLDDLRAVEALSVCEIQQVRGSKRNGHGAKHAQTYPHYCIG